MDGAKLQDFIDRYNDAWNAHDVDAILAMHTDDSVFENHVTGDVNVGREQIGRAVAGIFAVFPDLTFETRRAYFRDDLVVQEWTARGCYFGEAPHRIGAEPPRPEPSCDRRGLLEAGERAVEIALEPLEPAENSRERLAPIFGRLGPSG